jgi:hypothetical protein
MNFEKGKILTLYKRLISLYPQEFRERFGESMEQNFNDICDDQRKLKGRTSLTFMFLTFAETSLGVIEENIHGLKGAYQMNYWIKNFCIAALFSLFSTAAYWSLGIWSIPSEVEVWSVKHSLTSQIFFNWLVLTLVFTPIVAGLRNGENISMKGWLFPFAAAVMFGLVLIAPFAFMEYWNNPVIQSGEFEFPYMLFHALWLPPTIFFLVATPIVRSLRAGESILERPVMLIVRVLFLLFLAAIWAHLVRDQMPCFLGGVPGCD